jgi:hypothetical protein
MSKTVVAVLSLVLTLFSCFGQDQGDKSEPAIKKLERELEAALSKGDSVTLDDEDRAFVRTAST